MQLQTLHALLTTLKAKDLLDKKSNAVQSMYYAKAPASPIVLDAEMTIRDATVILAENNISSAPLRKDGEFV